MYFIRYEKSGTHRTEVPRLLYDDPGDLEAYVMKSKDRYGDAYYIAVLDCASAFFFRSSLRKWWAQYLESTGEMDGALQFYEAAQDYMSIVRVCCYMSRIDQAKEVATESGDRAACYHLARQLETMDQVRDAIEFYSKAQCLTNAIKLAKVYTCAGKNSERGVASIFFLGARIRARADGFGFTRQRKGHAGCSNVRKP